MRKASRVRYRLAETDSRNGRSLRARLTQGVDWTSDIYEPEVHAFGGYTSMDIAHELLHADSRYLLAFLSDAPTDRRERSLILCTALMRAVGLEVGEQGDVWARLAEQRSPCAVNCPTPPPGRPSPTTPGGSSSARPTGRRRKRLVYRLREGRRTAERPAGERPAHPRNPRRNRAPRHLPLEQDPHRRPTHAVLAQAAKEQSSPLKTRRRPLPSRDFERPVRTPLRPTAPRHGRTSAPPWAQC